MGYSAKTSWASSLVALSVAVFPFFAHAEEETLYDPENTTAPPDVAIEETLFDPENDGASEAAYAIDGGEELIDDPQNAQIRPAASEAATAPSAVESARFLGTWANTTAADLMWTPQEDVFEQTSELRLRLEYSRAGSFQAVAEVEFDHWWAFDERGENLRASYEARPGEAYVLVRQDRWTVGFGNMIHRWGVTDLTRPADVINPVDLTTITPDRAQRRIPQLAADVTWGPPDLRISAIVVPFFVPNRSWAFGRDTAAFSPSNPITAAAFPVAGVLSQLFDSSVVDDVQPVLQGTKVPDELPSGISGGVRLATTFANTDVAVGYFLGWDRTPSITLDETAAQVLVTVAGDTTFLGDLDFLGLLQRHPELLGQLNALSDLRAEGKTIFESTHERLHTFAIEGTRYVGPVGVRLDAAFHPQKTYLRDDFSTARVPTLAGALGLSFEDIDSETDARLISIEGFLTEPLEEGEYLAVGRRSAGVATALQWTKPWLESRAVGVFDLANSSVIGTVSVGHRFTTWLRVTGSVVVFDVWADDSSVTAARILRDNDFGALSLDGNF